MILFNILIKYFNKNFIKENKKYNFYLFYKYKNFKLILLKK